MKKIYSAALLAIFVGLNLVLTASSAFAQDPIGDTENSPDVVDTSGAWRLPFDGTMTISCAPGEGTADAQAGECKHIRWRTDSGTLIKDQAAIDYYNGANFPVLAPADGIVFDTGNQNPGYGRWLRINHNGTFSFFAHLSTYAPGISAGTSVRQGQQIGTSGRSGLPSDAGIHLHFDARVNVTASGNTSNGNPTMMLALPGNWFNRWYSPNPDLRFDTTRTSGGAQYPEQSIPPTTTTARGVRHLSNNQSPPNVLAGWTSNVSSSQLTLHFGAAPNTRGSSYATTFQVYEYVYNLGYWDQVPGGPFTVPAYTESIGAFNQADPNGQHSYQVSAQVNNQWTDWTPWIILRD